MTIWTKYTKHIPYTSWSSLEMDPLKIPEAVMPTNLLTDKFNSDSHGLPSLVDNHILHILPYFWKPDKYSLDLKIIIDGHNQFNHILWVIIQQENLLVKGKCQCEKCKDFSIICANTSLNSMILIVNRQIIEIFLNEGRIR